MSQVHCVPSALQRRTGRSGLGEARDLLPAATSDIHSGCPFHMVQAIGELAVGVTSRGRVFWAGLFSSPEGTKEEWASSSTSGGSMLVTIFRVSLLQQNCTFASIVYVCVRESIGDRGFSSVHLASLEDCLANF